jgi:Ca2+-binding EF-hand superfamily protein
VLLEAFKRFDTNGDGTLSASELAKLMQLIGAAAPHDEKAATQAATDLIHSVDENSDGSLNKVTKVFGHSLCSSSLVLP